MKKYLWAAGKVIGLLLVIAHVAFYVYGVYSVGFMAMMPVLEVTGVVACAVASVLFAVDSYREAKYWEKAAAASRRQFRG